MQSSILQPRVESTYVQSKLAGDVVAGPPTNVIKSDMDNEAQLEHFIANFPNLETVNNDVSMTANTAAISISKSPNANNSNPNAFVPLASARKPNHQSNLSTFLSSNINNNISTNPTHSDAILSQNIPTDNSGIMDMNGHIQPRGKDIKTNSYQTNISSSAAAASNGGSDILTGIAGYNAHSNMNSNAVGMNSYGSNQVKAPINKFPTSNTYGAPPVDNGTGSRYDMSLPCS